MSLKTLSDFPIAQHWQPDNAENIQLYSFPTPNGVKVSIALEELELAYDAHTVPLSQTTIPPFLTLNPNNKIPAIIDPNGPGGGAFGLWESGAILIYLAEKTGRLAPSDPALKYEMIQWLMFQIGGVGPMFGQYGFFAVFGGKDIQDPRPRERYEAEAKRLLKVLDQRLENRQWIMGDEYTIADIALWPWIRAAKVSYMAEEVFELGKYSNVTNYLERAVMRPASQRGLMQPPCK